MATLKASRAHDKIIAQLSAQYADALVAYHAAARNPENEDANRRAKTGLYAAQDALNIAARDKANSFYPYD